MTQFNPFDTEIPETQPITYVPNGLYEGDPHWTEVEPEPADTPSCGCFVCVYGDLFRT